MYAFCIKKLYNLYTTDKYKMYTKYIQNVSHIPTNVFIHFVYKVKRTMAAELCIQNVNKSLSNMGYILYTSFIHQFCSTKSVHHKNYIYNLYTKLIQNVYTNNCMQNGSHISRYFDTFVVYSLGNNWSQLRLETYWLSTSGVLGVSGAAVT